MKLKIFKKVSIMAAMVLALGGAVFAANPQSESYKVGSTSVTLTSGYNGTRAYAKTAASDYVDTYMECTGYYMIGYAVTPQATFSSSYDQTTYAEISKTFVTDLCKCSSYFQVTSSDSEIKKSLSTN